MKPPPQSRLGTYPPPQIALCPAPPASPGHTDLLPGTVTFAFSGIVCRWTCTVSLFFLSVWPLSPSVTVLKSTHAVRVSLVSPGDVPQLTHCLLPQGVARFWLLQVEPL